MLSISRVRFHNTLHAGLHACMCLVLEKKCREKEMFCSWMGTGEERSEHLPGQSLTDDCCSNKQKVFTSSQGMGS